MSEPSWCLVAKLHGVQISSKSGLNKVAVLAELALAVHQSAQTEGLSFELSRDPEPSTEES